MATTTPIRYWSLKGIATYTGRSYSEIKRLHSENRLPHPDLEVGGPAEVDDAPRPAYLPATVIEWWDRYLPQQRGIRTDLYPIDRDQTPRPNPPRALSLKGVATYAGLSYNTVKSYRNRDKPLLPDPDIEVGGPVERDGDPGADAIAPAYWTHTIDTWTTEGRRGRGARIDLHPRQQHEPADTPAS